MYRVSGIGIIMLMLSICLAAVTVSVDFNNTSDLTTYFNAYPGQTDVTNSSDSGIGNTGAVDLPSLGMYDTRVLTYKTGFHISQLDEPIIVSAYIYSQFNGGYAGIGLSSVNPNLSAPMCHITNTPAIGMQFYSSGASFFNNTAVLSGGDYSPDIPLSWYRLDFKIIPRAGSSYDISYDLYRANADGSIVGLTKSSSRNVVNTTLDDGLVYPYFAIDGHRVSYIDNFYFTASDDDTLPVTLSSFTATASSQTLVQLCWTTESESNLLGFNVYRSEDAEIAHAVRLNANIIYGTNTSSQHSYDYSDLEIESGTTYYYWLESAELDYNSSFYGPVRVTVGITGEDETPPVDLVINGIEKVFPNPFSPTAEIAYQLKSASDVRIDIYNQKGQLIRTLVNTSKEGGRYTIYWDGKDNSGKPCANGLYLARMQAGSENSFCKMMLLK